MRRGLMELESWNEQAGASQAKFEVEAYDVCDYRGFVSRFMHLGSSCGIGRLP